MSPIFERSVFPKRLVNLATPTPPLSLLHSHVLITTDVRAGEVDAQQASLVINYDVPSYVFLV